MVVANMDGPTRDQVLHLIEQKESIERELLELNAVLETNNNIGLHEPLVDNDGFPRSDVDVYRVRHARHRIICLQNDHTALMKQIEKGLHSLHANVLGNQNSSGTSAQHTALPMDVINTEGELSNGVAVMNVDGEPERAMVKVNLVMHGSPAETAGLCLDDEILSFGSVNSRNFQSINQIGEVVQHSINRHVDVKVRRNGQIINITLIPSQWARRGYLGCNIVPV